MINKKLEEVNENLKSRIHSCHDKKGCTKRIELLINEWNQKIQAQIENAKIIYIDG